MTLAVAQLPPEFPDTAAGVAGLVVDEVSIALTAPRLAHQRTRRELFTLGRFLAEEATILAMVDARDERASMRVAPQHTKELAPDQARAVTNIAESAQLVCPLSAPAGAGKTTSMRALRAVVNDHGGRVVMLAPTAAAVRVAMGQQAADHGGTVAKGLVEIGAGRLPLGPQDVVVVDEAAMVGTNDLRQLLAATTAAGAKIVPVGDSYQLAPVRARGGMFEQLCTDLQWTQRLSEVWRMKDPEERSASAALGRGGPAPRRRAVDWYAEHGRLHCGDDVAMAADAVDAWRADMAARKDALLLTDRLQMCDALNTRIHDQRIPADAETVVAGRGHEIAEGDVVITRENDGRIELDDAAILERPAPVCNGDRWRVIGVDTERDLIEARRLSDDAHATLQGDYLKRHVQLGYAVTVHTAQGVTADSVHAVLSEYTTRSLLYVGVTRGREDNHLYMYDRLGVENEHEHAEEQGVHVMRRGGVGEAAQTVQRIVATRDERPRTAHQIAAQTPINDRWLLPGPVEKALQDRDRAVVKRRAAWLRQQDENAKDVVAERRRQRVWDRRMDRAVREGDRKRDRAYKRDEGRGLSL